MPRALSVDLRERVLAAVEAGASCRQAAERFGVGAATAICWQARFRAEMLALGIVSAKAQTTPQTTVGTVVVNNMQ